MPHRIHGWVPPDPQPCGTLVTLIHLLILTRTPLAGVNVPKKKARLFSPNYYSVVVLPRTKVRADPIKRDQKAAPYNRLSATSL